MVTKRMSKNDSVYSVQSSDTCVEMTAIKTQVRARCKFYAFKNMIVTVPSILLTAGFLPGHFLLRCIMGCFLNCTEVEVQVL